MNGLQIYNAQGENQITEEQKKQAAEIFRRCGVSCVDIWDEFKSHANGVFADKFNDIHNDPDITTDILIYQLSDVFSYLFDIYRGKIEKVVRSYAFEHIKADHGAQLYQPIPIVSPERFERILCEMRSIIREMDNYIAEAEKKTPDGVPVRYIMETMADVVFDSYIENGDATQAKRKLSVIYVNVLEFYDNKNKRDE